MQYLKIGGIAIASILLLGLLVINLMNPFYRGKHKLVKNLTKHETPAQIHYYNNNGKQLRYLEVETPKNWDSTSMVFIHGAPGSLMDFGKYIGDSTLQSRYKMYSVDRLGYGDSNYGDAELSIKKHADIIAEFVKERVVGKVVLVGHSYGATIVGASMIYHGELYEKAFMLAPVNDPDTEEVFWFAKLGKQKWINWLIPKAFRVASYEKVAHIEALKDIGKDWNKINKPITHAHGLQDGLASPKNIAYCKSVINAKFLKTIVLEKAGHLFIFKDFETTRAIIMEEYP